MNSTTTMYVLLGFYVLITVQALWERKWCLASYYVGATIIIVSVLAMTLKTDVDHIADVGTKVEAVASREGPLR